MDIIPSLRSFAFCLTLAGSADALTPVSDNFNSTQLNKSRWSLKSPTGAGKLSQASGRILFTTSSSSDAEPYMDLRNSRPGYNENWEARVDVVNATNQGQDVAAGLWVLNADDPRDAALVEFYGKGSRGFNVIRVIDGRDTPNKDVRASAAGNQGSLRITFDKTRKLLTFWRDKTGPADGIKWEKITTFSAKNWNMNPGGGRFIIRLSAYSYAGPVTKGKVTLDNFALKARK